MIESIRKTKAKQSKQTENKTETYHRIAGFMTVYDTVISTHLNTESIFIIYPYISPQTINVTSKFRAAEIDGNRKANARY